MQTTQIIEERIRFGHQGRLCGILSYPAEGLPQRGVLLCSPHPNFAGDMQNNVITALAGKLAEDSVVLRFDYRGIGDSRIVLESGSSVFDYWDAVEQARDYADALADASDAASALARSADRIPIFILGYSFGAVIAARTGLSHSETRAVVGIAPPLTRIDFAFLANCPVTTLLISGLEDFVYDPVVSEKLIGTAGSKFHYDRLPGVDHFFRDREAELAERAIRFITEEAQ